MPVHLANEAELVADARAGDAAAFARLANQYERNVYRVAMSITGNREDAEDAMQEAFLKAFANLHRFQGGSRFYTWLTRITVNEALVRLRRQRSGREVSLDEPVAAGESTFMPREIEDWGNDPEKRYAGTELRELLERAITALEPPYRAVFLLRDVENFSTEETAEMLGLSIPAAKSRLLRARLKLREELNPYFKQG